MGAKISKPPIKKLMPFIVRWREEEGEARAQNLRFITPYSRLADRPQIDSSTVNRPSHDRSAKRGRGPRRASLVPRSSKQNVIRQKKQESMTLGLPYRALRPFLCKDTREGTISHSKMSREETSIESPTIPLLTLWRAAKSIFGIITLPPEMWLNIAAAAAGGGVA